jgi:hypothetical protein
VSAPAWQGGRTKAIGPRPRTNAQRPAQACVALCAQDTITVLRTHGPLATKKITRLASGEWQIEPYGKAAHFAVEEIAAAGLADLARTLARVARDPRAFVIRGRPLPGIDRTRCRRLLYRTIDEDGREHEPTLEPAARRWLAIDFDSLPTPVWNVEALARRRAAIRRDHEQRIEPWPLWRVDDRGELPQPAPFFDGIDPHPIDPARDPELVVRAALATLPAEFLGHSCWWQMTSSAGIKLGIRLRLWFWLDRPVSDLEAKRWLGGSPVDLALYSATQPHYIAAPIFDPPELDPVPRRSGITWAAGGDVVQVPELPEPPPPPAPEFCPRAGGNRNRRAESYAAAVFKGIATAPAGGRHAALRSGAITLFGMAEHGLLDQGTAWRDLIAAGTTHRWPERRLHQLLDWCAAFARVHRPLPEAFS